MCDTNILESQVSTFKNGANPGLLVKVGQTADSSGIGDKDDSPSLSRAQRKVLREMIKEATSGAINAGEPIILDAFIKEVSRITNTPAEMDFNESSLLVRDRILGIYGVPEVILGLNDNANRASAVIADEVFCYHTCAPICRFLSDHLTSWFRVYYRDDDLVVWIEPPRPRDPDNARADWDQLIRAGAVTLDEVRERIGLDPLPEGAGKILVRSGSARPETSDTGKTTPVVPPGKGNGRTIWDRMSKQQQADAYHDSRYRPLK
jgi:hypothetical protein